jgi:biotin carboxylase
VPLDLSRPCILVLGTNPETSRIVEVASGMNIRTVVSNQFKESPVKRVAEVSYDIDPRDSQKIDNLIRMERVDGVILGVSDPLLPYYLAICKRNNFPCYANEKSVEVFSSKSSFAEMCIRFGIKPIPQYGVTNLPTFEIDSEAFPVVVKPIDSGAALGVSICYNSVDLAEGINSGLNHSMRKQVLVEKAMMCDDIFAYYTFTNGHTFLTAIADRRKSIKQGGLSRVCLSADYPSQHLDKFLESVHPKLLSMFESIDIRNGVLCIQFFFDGAIFYAYDPGFRIQGEAPHHYVNALFGLDQLRAAINFSLGLGYVESSANFEPDPNFSGKVARTIWVLGTVGTIETIQGIDHLLHDERLISVHWRVKLGDKISEEMIGTERQVLARFHLLAQNTESLNEINSHIVNSLVVRDKEGVSMIQDIFSPYVAK